MQRDDLKKLFSLPVIVASLGYFVDIYDLLLFGIVRKNSLMALGIPEAQLLEQGEYLLRIQMTGLLVGGVLWGIMGDKRGRLSVLFGSILLYSLANIANGFVQTVDQYAILRLIAGIGLAGELGAGVTLVLESLPKSIRGYGTTIIASFGILGAVVAYFVSEWQDWRICYFIGGGLGLMLLVTRVSVFESGIFLKIQTKEVIRGNFFQLFTPKRFKKLIGCILIGLPLWYVIGILITFSPEFAKALSINEPVKAGKAIMVSYLGLSLGDLLSGLISQWIGSRKKVVAIFIGLTLVCFVFYLFIPVPTASFFYGTCFVMGIAIGYWALFVTIAAEQFGTNLRATVATSVPNFIRWTVVPLTLLFKFLRDTISESYPPETTETLGKNNGLIFGALIVGVFTIVVAFLSLRLIDETFGKDLNFEEEA
jgi:MFS transporter, putative metabolite:H+ symporter